MTLLSILVLAFTSYSSMAHQWQHPLTAEDYIVEKELQWAEKTMGNYQQKFESFPLRSSIRATHVYTEDWRRDSIQLLSSASEGVGSEQDLASSSSSSRNRNLRA